MMLQDLRYAIRVLRKNAGFTVVAAITVALGIAANVAVFSFIDAVFLRSLDVPGADRLVRIFSTSRNRPYGSFNYLEYAYIRDHMTTLDAAAHYSTAPLYVTVNGDSGEVQGAVVSHNYFTMLELKPALGRFFTAEEDSVRDRDAVAVIAYDFWHARLGSDPAVVGKPMVINGRSFKIAGVAPPGFRGVVIGGYPNQIWIPTMMLPVGYRFCDVLQEADCRLLGIEGRLAPHRTIAQANAELSALAGQLAAASPDTNRDRSATALPAAGVGPSGAREVLPLTRMLVVIAFALLAIACANLSGLLLARGFARAREIALRLSLGASRFRILRQLVTESMLLASFGGLLGLGLSLWISTLLIGFYATNSEGYQSWYDIRPNTRILACSVALSVAAGLLFGLLPAVQALRREVSLTSSYASAPRLGSTLVVAQIAISLCLVTGAFLLVRSVSRLQTGENWDPNHVVGVRLRPKLVGYMPAKAEPYQREVLRRIREVPGVESASLARAQGLVWSGGSSARLSLPGDAEARKDRAREIDYHTIASGFFETLRIPFIAGRDFDDGDRADAPLVAIVNEALADKLWPHASALDQIVLLDNVQYRVVGVVKNAQFHNDLESPPPMAFTSYWQCPTETDSRMCIRVRGDPAAALPGIRRVIRGIDPQVPITEAMPLVEQVRGHFSSVRLARGVLVYAGALAVLLSAIGLYSILAFSVSRRTREIGIRMAVGARPSQVLQLFVRRGLIIALLGSAAGLTLAAIGTRSLAAWLYGIPATDAVAFSAAALLLTVTALLASAIPARRAARIDPVDALRHE